MNAPSCSALAKNGRNFGSDSSCPSTLSGSPRLQFQLGHDVVEFADCDFRLLQGNDAKSDESVRLREQ